MCAKYVPYNLYALYKFKQSAFNHNNIISKLSRRRIIKGQEEKQIQTQTLKKTVLYSENPCLHIHICHLMQMNHQ